MMVFFVLSGHTDLLKENCFLPLLDQSVVFINTSV